MQKQFNLASHDDTVRLGAALAESIAKKASSGLVVYLGGTLGAGKTTFCRGVLSGLGHSGSVKSPTYTLVEPYNLVKMSVYHFDLYRLSSPEELEYLGIRDYFEENALCLIEWYERGLGALADPDLEIQLDVCGSGRMASLCAFNEKGEVVLNGCEL